MRGGGAEQQDRTGLGAAVSRITEGLGRLVSDHIALAKVELRDDVKVFATNAAKIAAFVPLILLGYALLCVALGVWLGQWLGLAGGLAVVGAVNLIGGGLGIWAAASKLKDRPVMNDTLTEVTRTKAALSTVTRPNGNGLTTPTERRLGS